MNDFIGKKVLVFGLGLNQGGVGAARFFAKKGALVRVTDLKTKVDLASSLKQLSKFKNIKYTLGKHLNSDFDWADLIIKNPSVKLDNKFLKYAQKKKKLIETDIGIFLQFVNPSQIVGITGTKGKSTTSSMIYSVLKLKYKDTTHSGNIGTSVLDSLSQITPKTLIVLELSSFHLEGFEDHQVSPKWAIITNIFPDHLNYYKNFTSYITAKKVIAKYQQPGNYLFINRNDQITGTPSFLKGLSSRIAFFSKDDLLKNFKPQILGEHNLDNFSAALAVAKTFGIDSDKALKILEKLKPVEFRLEFIKSLKGVKIYNDSSATVPDATIQALKTLPNSILICGGMNKKLNYQDLAKIIDKNAKAVFFLEGDATNLIKKSLKRKNKIMGTFKDINELLRNVKEKAKKGDTILFSPGATSFNLFQNEFDRGRKFNEAVKKVFK